MFSAGLTDASRMLTGYRGVEALIQAIIQWVDVVCYRLFFEDGLLFLEFIRIVRDKIIGQREVFLDDVKLPNIVLQRV